MMEWVTSWIYFSDHSVRPTTRAANRPEDAREPQPSRPRILVVDDQKLIVDTIAEILEGAGFEVAVACDGWKALDMAARFHPDRLLTDVLMPGMNGVELAIAVQTMYPSVKILLFSGQAGISEVLEVGEQRGFKFEVIPKPIHPRKLIERILEQDRPGEPDNPGNQDKPGDQD
jgi:CheY-like chemotaxis protein